MSERTVESAGLALVLEPGRAPDHPVEELVRDDVQDRGAGAQLALVQRLAIDDSGCRPSRRSGFAPGRPSPPGRERPRKIILGLSIPIHRSSAAAPLRRGAACAPGSGDAEGRRSRGGRSVASGLGRPLRLQGCSEGRRQGAGREEPEDIRPRPLRAGRAHRALKAPQGHPKGSTRRGPRGAGGRGGWKRPVR